MNISKLKRPITIGLILAVGVGLPSALVLSNGSLRPAVQTVTKSEGTVQFDSEVQLALAKTGLIQNEAKAEQLMRLKSESVSRGGDSDDRSRVTTTSSSALDTTPTPLHGSYIGDFRITAYDLSVQSCGKQRWHKGYGITASGINISGKDVRNRYIAVDPRIFKLHTKIYIEFPEEVRYIQTPDGEQVDLNGVYEAVDTGSAIIGQSIDLFVGEDQPGQKSYYNIAMNFGLNQAKVYNPN